ncbi:hypothetical protein JW887_02450 [Candidatus Dojkabacteria bacterium]|nr:hypothetical protein [Candidatus Dojkabacteria bacterium]
MKESNKKTKNRKWIKVLVSWVLPVLIYALLAIFVSRKVIFSEGHIGFIHDWALPRTQQESQMVLSKVFYAYTDRDLGTSPSYLTDYTFTLIIGTLGKLGISGTTVSKLIIFSSVFLSGTNLYIFLRRSLKAKPFPSFWAGLFYAISPYIFYKIIAGHIYFLFGYMILPIFGYFVERAFRSKSIYKLITSSLIAGVLLSFAGWQIQFYIFGAVLYAIIFFSSKAKTANKIANFAILFLTNIILCMPWFIPLFSREKVTEQFQGYVSYQSIIRQSKYSILSNIIRGREGSAPYFSETLNSLPQYQADIYNIVSYFIAFISISGIVISIVAFFSSIFNKITKNPKNRKTSILQRFCIISIPFLAVFMFLANGSNFPTGDFIIQLYKNISILGLFREIYHIAYIIVFFFNIYLAFFLDKVIFNRELYNSPTKKLPKFFKLITNVILVILFLGMVPVYASGNFGNHLKTYTLDSDLLELQENLSGERVIFLPNMQPYNPDPDANWGGWNVMQVYGQYSTTPQGGITNPYQKTIINRINYCLIFDDNCYNEVPTMLKDMGITKIVVLNDIYSLNYRFTALGLESNNKNLFKEVNYEERLDSLNFTKLENNSKYVLYDIPDTNPVISANNTLVSMFGGIQGLTISETQDAEIIGSHRGSINSEIFEESDGVIIENNKILLTQLELNPNTLEIEPGYFVEDNSWNSYFNYWWREGFSDSGYNGVYTESTNAVLTIPITIPKSQKYDIYVNLGTQNAQEISKFAISFENIDGRTKIDNTNIQRNYGIIEAAKDIHLEKGQVTMILRNLKGPTKIDSIYLVPSNDEKIDLNFEDKSIFLINSVDTINSYENNPLRIETDLSDYEISAYKEDENKTKYKFTEGDPYNIIEVEYSKDNLETGEFVSLRYPLNGIPVQKLQLLERFEFEYSLSSPNDTYIDVAITITHSGKTSTMIVQKEFTNNNTGKVTVDFNNVIKNLEYKILDTKIEDIAIQSIVITLNRNRLIDLDQNTKYTYQISNPVFTTDQNKLISENDFYDTAYYLNQNMLINYLDQNYSDSKVEISTDPLNPEVSLNSYQAGERNTSVDFSQNNYTLNITESAETSEFATLSINIEDPEIIGNYDYLVIPATFDEQAGFIDVMLRYSNQEDKYSDPLIFTSTKNSGGNIIINLSEMLKGHTAAEIESIEIIMNKNKWLSQDIRKVNFQIGNINLLKNNNSKESITNFEKKFITVYSPVEDTFILKMVQPDGKYISSEVKLKVGINQVNLPSDSDTITIKYCILERLASDWNPTKIFPKYKKIDSTNYEVVYEKSLSKMKIITIRNIYDADWQIEQYENSKQIRTNMLFNSFLIENIKENPIEIDYSLQVYREYSLWITLATALIVSMILAIWGIMRKFKIINNAK